MTTEVKTCSQCQNWFRLGGGPTPLIGQGMGQCRGAPPQVLVTGAGPQGLNLTSQYPVVSADFPTCAAFRPGPAYFGRPAHQVANGEDAA